MTKIGPNSGALTCDRIGSTGDLNHVDSHGLRGLIAQRLLEVVDELLRVHGGGHDHNSEVAALCGDDPQHAQQHVCGDVTLVHLVHDHTGVLLESRRQCTPVRQQGVGLKLFDQNALRDELQLRAAAAGVEANLVSNLL